MFSMKPFVAGLSNTIAVQGLSTEEKQRRVGSNICVERKSAQSQRGKTQKTIGAGSLFATRTSRAKQRTVRLTNTARRHSGALRNKYQSTEEYPKRLS